MPWVAPLIMAGGSLAGSAMAASAQNNATRQSRELIEKAVRQYEEIGVPSAEALQVVMEELKSAGELTPELEEAISQKDSELKGISVDPRSKEAQYNALSELEEIGMGGGLRLSDKASIEEVMGDIGSRERGAREAIESQMKARGAFGGGAELASKLASHQEQAQAASRAGLDIAANAQDRALQAIMQAGELGGNLRGTDFAEQRAIAEAQDEINRFNTANRSDVVRRNSDRENAAREYNLRNAQRIMDENTGTRNANSVRNADLKQQEFENKMKLASGKANAYTGQANQVQAAGKDSAAMWGKVGQGVGQVGAAIAQGTQNQANTGGARLQTHGPRIQDSRVNPSYLGQDEERMWV